MKIETKQELKYMMDFLNIQYVCITDNGKDLGKVTNSMKYKGGARVYKKEYEYLAYEKACEQLSQDYEEIKVWKEISKQVFVTRLLIGEWDKEKKPETWYTWESDVEKCHIVMSKDADGKVELKGRIHDLNNFISYANDHMRYVRSRYSLESERVNHYIKLFDRYGLQNPDDDSYEWWRVGIVD